MIQAAESVCTVGDRDHWLAARRAGIGSSDAPIIVLGQAFGRSRTDLWMHKLGLEQRSDDDGHARLEWGHRLEQLAREEFERATGQEVIPALHMYRSRERPWQLATPDGFVVDAHGKVEALVEIKTTTHLAFWTDEEDGVPPYVKIQLHHQGLVMGVTTMYAVVLGGGFDGIQFYYRPVEWNAELASEILAAETEFYRCMEEGTPPEPGVSDGPALTLLYREVDEGEVIALPGEFVELDERLVAIKDERKQLDREVERLQNKIKSALGTAEAGRLPNGVQWIWAKHGKGRRLRRKS